MGKKKRMIHVEVVLPIKYSSIFEPMSEEDIENYNKEIGVYVRSMSEQLADVFIDIKNRIGDI